MKIYEISFAEHIQFSSRLLLLLFFIRFLILRYNRTKTKQEKELNMTTVICLDDIIQHNKIEEKLKSLHWPETPRNEHSPCSP